MKMLRLNDRKGIREARRTLWDTGTLFVSFAAQGTHLPLLVLDPLAVVHYGYQRGHGHAGSVKGYHYVGYMEFGGLYPFVLGHLDSGYVEEKLRMRHAADALNVTGFLNALGQATQKALDEYMERLKLSPYDDTALDYDYYKLRGGPR